MCRWLCEGRGWACAWSYGGEHARNCFHCACEGGGGGAQVSQGTGVHHLKREYEQGQQREGEAGAAAGEG